MPKLRQFLKDSLNVLKKPLKAGLNGSKTSLS